MELMFSLLLLGCSHDLQQCEGYSSPSDLYATRQACEEVIPLALHAPDGYPMVTAKCVQVTATVDIENRIDVAFEKAEIEAVRTVPINDYAQVELLRDIET